MIRVAGSSRSRHRARFVVALVSVQLTSAVRLLPEMGRAAGIEYDAAARWAPDPRDVLTVIFLRAYAVPNREFQDTSGALLWEKADYVSLLLPVLSIWPVLLAAGVERGPDACALGLLTYIVAMANALPLFRLHYSLLGGFRYPGRLLPVFSVAIAALGAVGLDALLAWARNGMRAPRVKPAAAAIGAGLVGMGCLQSGGSESMARHRVGHPSLGGDSLIDRTGVAPAPRSTLHRDRGARDTGVARDQC